MAAVQEDLLQCPFEKSHQILRSRMQTHLTKCRRNHPDEPKATCPFNATHIVAECELKYHMSMCDDQKLILREITKQEPVESVILPISDISISCDENWDNVNVPTYDPNEQLENRPILRDLHGAKPSERRLFRSKEVERLQRLKEVGSAGGSVVSEQREDNIRPQPLSFSMTTKNKVITQSMSAVNNSSARSNISSGITSKTEIKSMYTAGRGKRINRIDD